MLTHSIHHRLTAGALLAACALITLAPAAHAGRGWGQERKFRRSEHAVYASHRDRAPSRVIEYRRGSGGGSTLAGFLGGIAVGAILSNAAQAHASVHAQYSTPPSCPAPALARYSYDDPYCRERFGSLDLYMAHARQHHHALVAQVIDDRDGDCVDVVRYANGGWQSCDRDDRGRWDYDGNDD